MEKKSEKIHIELPISEEYAHFLRLMVSGIASRMDFSLDEVDDLKIAAEEAYLMAINCCFNPTQKIDFDFSSDELTIIFRDLILPRAGLDDNQKKEQDYSVFIINAVVDEVGAESKDDTSDLIILKRVKAVEKKGSPA